MYDQNVALNNESFNYILNCPNFPWTFHLIRGTEDVIYEVCTLSNEIDFLNYNSILSPSK